MIDERTEEQASLHAFGLLPPEEARAFEERILREPELRRLVDELRETAAALALAAPAAQPRPELRARILAAAAERRPQAASTAPAPVAYETRPPRRLFGWAPWGLAALFALAAGVSFLGYRDTQRRAVRSALLAETYFNDLETLRAQLDQQRTLAQMKISTLVSMLDNSPQAVAVALWNPAEQSGLLHVQMLPEATAEQDYQLWVIDPSKPGPVSAGVIPSSVRAGGMMPFHPVQPVANAAKFAISLERKGGEPEAPKGKIVVVSF